MKEKGKVPPSSSAEIQTTSLQNVGVIGGRCSVKTFLRLAMLVLLGLGIGAGLAELVAMALLPAPVPWQLPLVRAEADEVCGYRHRPSHVGYSLSSQVTINRWGFRGQDWEVDKAPGVLRIVLLGDSLVFGQGVSDGETFGAQLEKILNTQAAPGWRYEVLNFGVSGYDTGHELKVLKHYALRFRPDLVLLHFF